MIVYAYPHHALEGRTPPGSWTVITEDGDVVLTRVVNDGADIADVLGPVNNGDAYFAFCGVQIDLHITTPDNLPAEVVGRYIRKQRNQ